MLWIPVNPALRRHAGRDPLYPYIFGYSAAPVDGRPRLDWGGWLDELVATQQVEQYRRG